jgi:D-aminopeptidase
VRARDLGIDIGLGTPGALNAITDVPGIRVGHETLIRGNGPLVVGEGPVRTGVTVIVPHDRDVWTEPLFAGCHILNGNGDMTGLEWIREAGLLVGAIGITNTHSVGTVRDALVRHAVRSRPHPADVWTLPVVGETFDGTLNDQNGFHVRAEHVDAALAAATSGPVAEGAVGGGTGSICHEFKAGIGSASRIVSVGADRYVLGVLVQANFGSRHLLRIDGLPVGREIPITAVPSPYGDRRASGRAGGGSIIGIIATDAPLLPHQCARLAQRAGLGMARTGGIGSTSSGDLFLAFSTGNRGLPPPEVDPGTSPTTELRALVDAALDPLFVATIDATEEAILNSMIAAETMVGRDGITAHRLPHDRLREILGRHGRLDGDTER